MARGLLTRAITPIASSSCLSCCITGARYANVLPEPVKAQYHTHVCVRTCMYTHNTQYVHLFQPHTKHGCHLILLEQLTSANKSTCTHSNTCIHTCMTVGLCIPVSSTACTMFGPKLRLENPGTDSTEGCYTIKITHWPAPTLTDMPSHYQLSSRFNNNLLYTSYWL